MRFNGATIFSLSFLAACAGTPPSIDKEQAISLADRACFASWGKLGERNGQSWTVSKKDWQAKIENGHWRIWLGDEKRPGMSVNVSLDGSAPDPGSCEVLFED